MITSVYPHSSTFQWQYFVIYYNIRNSQWQQPEQQFILKVKKGKCVSFDNSLIICHVFSGAQIAEGYGFFSKIKTHDLNFGSFKNVWTLICNMLS